MLGCRDRWVGHSGWVGLQLHLPLHRASSEIQHSDNPPSSAAVAVVMESTTGGILLKSALRVLGTALAGLLGVG